MADISKIKERLAALLARAKDAGSSESGLGAEVVAPVHPTMPSIRSAAVNTASLFNEEMRSVAQVVNVKSVL